VKPIAAPLPSVVAVTNLQNGRELRLRVNDRGPFVGDRLIDVSRRAAQLLAPRARPDACIHCPVSLRRLFSAVTAGSVAVHD